MKTRLLLLLIVTLFWLTTTKVDAGVWMIDNVRVWSVDRVCQDGAFVHSYRPESSLIEPFGTPMPEDLTVSSYLLPDDFFDQANINLTTFAENQYEQYGMVDVDGVDISGYVVQTLQQADMLAVEEQETPLFVGFADGHLVNYYAVSRHVWQPTLPVGALVAIDLEQSGNILVAHVADCTLPQVGDVQRVSVSSDGVEGDADSAEAALSADGTRIAFSSFASNLAAASTDLNATSDIFAHSLTTDNTQLVSYAGSTARPTAVGDATQPDMSYDGNRIVFATENLVVNLDACSNPENDGEVDVFSWDWTSSVTRQHISVYQHVGSFCNALDQASYRPAINQRDVVFTTDTVLDGPSNGTVEDDNEGADVLLIARGDEDTSTVSALLMGLNPLQTGNNASDNAVLAARKQWVAYETRATNFYNDSNLSRNDIVLTDTDTQTHTLISVASDGTQANRSSYYPAISALANHIAFETSANNLHSGAPIAVRQIYVRDVAAGCTTLLSQSADGVAGDANSTLASISADGRFVVFQSDATNLVTNDNNGVTDIFLVDRDADSDGDFYGHGTCVPDKVSIRRISLTHLGAEADAASTDPDIAANGAYVAFTSAATKLVEGDTNSATDVFITYVGHPALELETPLAIDLLTTDNVPQHKSVLFASFWLLLLLTALRATIRHVPKKVT